MKFFRQHPFAVAATAWIVAPFLALARAGGSSLEGVRLAAFLLLPLVTVLVLQAESTNVQRRLRESGQSTSTASLLPESSKVPESNYHLHPMFLVLSACCMFAAFMTSAAWPTADAVALRVAAVATAVTCLSLTRTAGRSSSMKRAWRVRHRWGPTGMLAVTCFFASGLGPFDWQIAGTRPVAAGTVSEAPCASRNEPDEPAVEEAADTETVEDDTVTYPPQMSVLDYAICGFDGFDQIVVSLAVYLPDPATVENLDAGLDGVNQPAFVFSADPEVVEDWDSTFATPRPATSSLAPKNSFVLEPNASGRAELHDEVPLNATNWPRRLELVPGGEFFDGRSGYGRLVFTIPDEVGQHESFKPVGMVLMGENDSWRSQTGYENWSAPTANPTRF